MVGSAFSFTAPRPHVPGAPVTPGPPGGSSVARARAPLLVHLLFILLTALTAPSVASGYQYTTHYINVSVDHFSFARPDTFKLRYLVNDTWWDKNSKWPGPIFFYTGNEGDITLFAENTGFMWDIAKEFRALVVFAEHRYYGQSMPFGNKSLTEPQYSGYLTSQQALADFVQVIAHLRSGQEFPELSPVIAFGGSYGGMLSAWIRMKYPNMVAGAIAASAPVYMSAGIVPCDAFMRIVTSDYTAVDPNCSDNIRRSWAAIRNATNTDQGKEWLSRQYKLRTPLKTATDVKDLLDWINEAFVDVAMANYPYPADFLGDMPAYPVKEVCKPLMKKITNETQLIDAVFKGMSVYFNYTGKARNIDVHNSDSMLGLSGWDFQACTEMAMPICSNGKADMFEFSAWDYKEYAENCFKRWKVYPSYNLTKYMYHGRDLKGASNIVFSNGLQDPWSCGGVVRNVSDSVLAVLIPEGAHHLDLRAANPADPSSVISARKLHRKSIKRWIKEHWRNANLRNNHLQQQEQGDHSGESSEGD